MEVTKDFYNAYTDDGWDWSDEGPEGTEWRWGAMENNNNSWTNWRPAVYQSGTGPREALLMESITVNLPYVNAHRRYGSLL